MTSDHRSAVLRISPVVGRSRRVGFFACLGGLHGVADVAVGALVVDRVVSSPLSSAGCRRRCRVVDCRRTIRGQHHVAVAVDGDVAFVEHAGLGLDDALVVAAVVAVGTGRRSTGRVPTAFDPAESVSPVLALIWPSRSMNTLESS